MKCPNCGNEVNQDEAFCGQCGIPVANIPPARPTETVNSSRPPATRSWEGPAGPQSPPSLPSPQPPAGAWGVSAPQGAATPHLYGSGMLPPSNANNASMSPPPGNSQIAQRPPSAPLSNSPQAGTPQLNAQSAQFYQDATEAISALPPGNPQGYPQQNFAGTIPSGGYPGVGQYSPQAFPSGQAQRAPLQTVPRAGYTQHPLPGGQGYAGGIQPRLTPPPQKQQDNTALVIVSVLLVVVLLVAIGLGAAIVLRSHSSPQGSTGPLPTVAATATAVPSPTLNPTANPSPTLSPTPVITPTPEPDAGFAWCDQSCTNNGFIVEYPQSWQTALPADGSGGASFTNPQAADEVAVFKTMQTTLTSASDVVTEDLQKNFASRTGYVAPTSSPTAAPFAIGGDSTWVYTTATYQSTENQPVTVQVYGVLRDGKAYIIELQALQSQFESMVYPQYYQPMLQKFQFQQSTQP